MNSQSPLPLEEVDQIELPLDVLTAEIEKLGRIVDAIRATQATRLLDAPPDVNDELLAKAVSIYRFRRQRDDAFGQQMFADPRWDILLDLFIAGRQRRTISISSACIGACAPSTTALRHLSALVKHGLVRRESSEFDLRTHWVELTEEGRDKIERLLRCLTVSTTGSGAQG